MTPAKLIAPLDDDRPMPPVKVIASAGVWQVPPAERPRGWQAMGLREKPRARSFDSLSDTARRFVSGAR